MRREGMLVRVKERKGPWDIAVIGGGATGMGVAVDAAARGLSVVLVEAHGFGKGTSSRSTKLVHGGVRYLEQGNIPLVMSALKERGILRRNAPHLVHDLAFIVPLYSWWEAPFYGIGLKLYDKLAGKYGFGASKLLSRSETLARLPELEPKGLRGGVIYYDGQFDDTRLLLHLAMTAADHGAALINYCPAIGFMRGDSGKVNGVIVRDEETSEELSIPARIVVNATGAFTDTVRRLVDRSAAPLMVTSQGIHLVFKRGFLKGETALMVPRTRDGRVLFVIPWHGHIVAGTTDTPVGEPSLEPRPHTDEIEFILQTAGHYLARPPRKEDILSAFVGLRPLVKGEGKTSALSRDHLIHVDPAGLLTITGGKWTTYRHMAEDCVNHAIVLGELPQSTCTTKNLEIHGFLKDCSGLGSLNVYGSDAEEIRALARSSAGMSARLHPDLPYIAAEIVWAARHEMARTVEDALARHTRSLFLNAGAAIQMAGPVAALLATELNRDQAWVDAQTHTFQKLAEEYRSL